MEIICLFSTHCCLVSGADNEDDGCIDGLLYFLIQRKEEKKEQEMHFREWNRPRDDLSCEDLKVYLFIY